MENTAPESHPLFDLLRFYYRRYPVLRENNQDIDNLSFHHQFGLRLNIPADWPLISSITNLIEYMLSRVSLNNNVAIIYPSTAIYKEVSCSLQSKQISPIYFSWQEFYVAMDRAGKDARELQRFKSILRNAHLVIFCGAPSEISEVINQICGFCDGCLVILN